MHQRNRKDSKYRMSLRYYFSMVSIITLCTACLLSFGIVIAGLKLFYHGAFTPMVAVGICLIVCCLTMLLGGIMLWHGTAHLIKPIEAIINAVNKVADGDFTVHIERNAKMRGEYQFANELDELSLSFNKMTAELNGMDYMRKDFISNVSHEVQTPVAAITGFTEILINGGLSDEEQKEYLTLVNKESMRLSRLCDNMLRMSRLDNQQIVVRNNKVRVDEQLRKCIILLSEKWPDKNRNYELEYNELVIQSDADLLMQIWSNLIDNAIKYSWEDSTILIDGKIEDNELVVKIQDKGFGIPKDKLPNIFEKFYQCEESHEQQGNGLGLSIVRRIVELLGGRILCTSEVGIGTTMEVRLPINQER